MKRVFKSKKNNTKALKKTVTILLISIIISFILSKTSIFNNSIIDLLKTTSLNEFNNNKIDLKGEYLLNVGLNTFDNIHFTKEVFVENKKQKKEDAPRIYIYNTHQTEEYQTIENYNLTPTVLTASFILKDMLKEYNINAIVEESDLKTDLNNLGITYNNAYTVSRMWLDKLNNPNLDLYIDLHRDSINYNLSNIKVDGKDYAKIMFVIGANHDYIDNMNLANSLVNEIEKINKDISRGIFTRKNSVYNQDYNKNCVLIELGGPESTYESISNSLKVLSLAIKNYLGE